MDRRQIIEEILSTFHGIKHVVESTFRPIVSEHDFTYSQMMILRVVKHNPGISIKELAGLLGITSSAVTQQVDALVRKGYLVREGNVDDRRSLSLRLSAGFNRQAEEIQMVVIKKLNEYFSVLTDDELAAYAALNRKLANKITEK
ncbi:MAG: MarR family transcriptional regulator [Chloroflexi bacterium]|nr:MarR family transcriptional regulator [Chloroflexota bacterium]